SEWPVNSASANFHCCSPIRATSITEERQHAMVTDERPRIDEPLHQHRPVAAGVILGKAFPRLKTHPLAAYQCDELPARRLGKSRLEYDERAEFFLRQFEIARDFSRRRHEKSGGLEALDLFDLRYKSEITALVKRSQLGIEAAPPRAEKAIQDARPKGLVAPLIIAISLLVSLLSLFGASASTQAPKTIKIIVPSTAGGGADILARILADQISQPPNVAVVENRRSEQYNRNRSHITIGARWQHSSYQHS